jgi:hypothetical protein
VLCVLLGLDALWAGGPWIAAILILTGLTLFWLAGLTLRVARSLTLLARALDPDELVVGAGGSRFRRLAFSRPRLVVAATSGCLLVANAGFRGPHNVRRYLWRHVESVTSEPDDSDDGRFSTVRFTADHADHEIYAVPSGYAADIVRAAQLGGVPQATQRQ